MLLQGMAATGQNNFREAERSFNKAIEMNPNLAEAYFERGLLFVQQDRIAPWISDLQRYVQLVNPDDAGTPILQVRELIGQLRSTAVSSEPSAGSMQGGD